MIYGKYGEYYDLIYSAKNYNGECKGLVDYFKKFSRGKVRNVLDVGCGTGNHSILLAEKGYKTVGIDFSKVMITQARKKAEKKNLAVEFHVQDIRSFDLKRKFDVAICLFGTLGYCITEDEIRAVLLRIRNHLKKGGLFIFDFWPVHAYARGESWQTVREIKKDETSIIRIMDGSFDFYTNLVRLKIKCYILRGAKLIDSFQEEHNLRTFTLPEMACILKENSFRPLSFFKIEWQTEKPYSFNKVDLKTANVACVTRKFRILGL